jgi:RNA polymerase sigma-70 factor (ECF subfamily)
MNAGIRRASDCDLATLGSADLYRRLQPRVEHLVMCLLSGRTAPADLVHDASAEVVMSKGHFRHESEFGPWVDAIVRRQVYKWLRGQQRYSRLLRDLAVQPAARAPERPDESAEATRALRRTAEVLKSLPVRQQRCILLLEVDGLSVQHAAKRLGVTPAAVRSAACRVRARLRESLGETESAGARLVESSKHSAGEQTRTSHLRRGAHTT